VTELVQFLGFSGRARYNEDSLFLASLVQQSETLTARANQVLFLYEIAIIPGDANIQVSVQAPNTENALVLTETREKLDVAFLAQDGGQIILAVNNLTSSAASVVFRYLTMSLVDYRSLVMPGYHPVETEGWLRRLGLAGQPAKGVTGDVAHPGR